MGDGDVTLGELSRLVTKIDETVGGMWRELKEIRAGFVSQREHEEHRRSMARDIERASTDARQQINGVAKGLRETIANNHELLRREIQIVAGDVKELAADQENLATRRWSVWSSLFVAVTAALVGAGLTGLLLR